MCPRAVGETERVRLRWLRFAADTFAFYMCYRCRSPYFGGKKECANMGGPPGAGAQGTSSPPPISFLPVHPLTTTARLAQEGLSTRRNWCAARAATRPDKRARSTAKSTWRWVASRSAKCPGLDSVVTYRRLLSSAAVEVPFLLPARDVLLCGQGPLLRPMPRRTRYQHLHPLLREPHAERDLY